MGSKRCKSGVFTEKMKQGKGDYTRSKLCRTNSSKPYSPASACIRGLSNKILQSANKHGAHSTHTLEADTMQILLRSVGKSVCVCVCARASG